jgi:HlyD family secretion protein
VPRKWWITGAAALVFAAAGGVAVVLRAHKPKSPKVASVPSAAVEPNGISLTGRVQPRASILVAAPLEGTLESFFVDVNQEVYRGQLLGRIRSGTLETAEQQAQLVLDKAETRVTTLSGDQLAARLEASRATVDQSRARTEVERLEKAYRQQKGLWEAGATPRLTFEKAEKDYTAARTAIEHVDTIARQASDRAAAVEAAIEDASRAVADATAALEHAKTELSTAEVHSPADGIVMARRGQPGDPEDPSIKDLLQIGTELTSLQVLLTPDPATLARIHAGQAVTVRVPELAPDEIPGIVREIRGSDVIVDFASPTAATKLDLAAQVRIKF